MTLQELLRDCLNNLWASAKDSEGSYANGLDVISIIGPSRPVASLRLADVARLKQVFNERGLSPATINRKMSCMSAMLRHARESGIACPPLTFPHGREAEPRSRVLTQDEINTIVMILRSFGEEPYAMLVIFLLETGLRVSEALSLRWVDVTVASGVVLVRQTKGAKPRTIPMSARALSALNAMRGSLESFSPDDGPFIGLSQSRFNHLWSRVRASMPTAKGDPEFVPHALRHTLASRLLAAGVNLAVIQKWLGHASITTTMRYAHLDAEALQMACKKLEADHG